MLRPHRVAPAPAALALAMIILTACASPGDRSPSHTRGSTPPSSAMPARLSPSEKKAVASSCGGTSVRTRNPPTWATGGFSGDTPPYVQSAHRAVVAYLFGFPLKAPRPAPPKTDKILWFAQQRDQPLHLTAHRLSAPAKVVSRTIGTTGSGSLPSHVPMPAPGCWRFDLTWNGGRHDTIDIRYYAR